MSEEAVYCMFGYVHLVQDTAPMYSLSEERMVPRGQVILHCASLSANPLHSSTNNCSILQLNHYENTDDFC